MVALVGTVWQNGVWADTVWAAGVWGAVVVVPSVSTGGGGGVWRRQPKLASMGYQPLPKARREVEPEPVSEPVPEPVAEPPKPFELPPIRPFDAETEAKVVDLAVRLAALDAKRLEEDDEAAILMLLMVA